MDFMQIKDQEQKNIMPTYGRFDVALVLGKNATAYDYNGTPYIDFTSGIGVNSLGYCDEEWVEAVAKQASTLQHISNLYYSPVQTKLAEKLCEMSGYSKVFFGNSGAEANECAIKVARQYSAEKYSPDRYEIITLKNSFHGRTLTTLAATGQDSFHSYFTPLTTGFTYAQANSMESVKEQYNQKTCAVMLEFIQGEGGVLPLDQEFVKQIKNFCEENDLLFIADEVQTGMGRTGKLFCFENYHVRPDIITSAKGLGGGLPIGACLCIEKLGSILGSGMHGSTFGGNPVVCAGALTVLKRFSEPKFFDTVCEKGAYMSQKLKEMPQISEVRGMGLMLGAALKKGTAKEVAAECVKNGLLVLTAKDVLRFLPPLTIRYEEIDKGLSLLQKVLEGIE